MARRLTRNRRDAILGGVASGYGDYFDIDPVLVRLGFVFLCFLNGIGAIFYLVSWAIMPVREEAGTAAPPVAGTAPPGDHAPLAGDPSSRDAPPPPRGTPAADGGIGARAEKVVEEVREVGERVIADVRRSAPGGGGALTAGIVLIIIGMVFLVDRLPWLHWPHWLEISGLWPLVLIGIGVAMLLGARRGGGK